MKWISIKEQEPPDDVSFLVTDGHYIDHGGREGFSETIEKDGWEKEIIKYTVLPCHNSNFDKITHWCLVPVLPKEAS